MPIQTKIPGLKKDGTFPMMCVEISKDPSKTSNRPMLTVLWKSLDPANEGGALAWLVMDHPVGIEKYTKCKIALGLGLTAKGDDFVGLKAMVTLKLKAPNEQGKVFSEVVAVEKFDPNWKEEKASANFLAPPKLTSNPVIDF